MVGGLGSTDAINDFRIYKNDENKFEKIVFTNEDKLFHLEPRYAHSLHYFKNNIVVYGGGGPYLSKLKCRATFSDIRMLDMLNKQ